MDFVVEYLKKIGQQLTRKNYLALDRPGVDPSKPLPAELEAELPAEIQLKS